MSSIVLGANVRLKSLLWVCLSAPLVWLGWRICLEYQLAGSGLGADPVEAVVHFLGEWALIILLISFSVSPLRRIFKQPVFGRSRRLVGLFAFAYVLLHALGYLVLYLEFSMAEFLADLAERTYITAGMAALTGLMLMAATSTRAWQRRLGSLWRRLHLIIYAAVVLALLHFWWLTRDGYGEPLLYTAWFALLLCERGWRRRSASVSASS